MITKSAFVDIFNSTKLFIEKTSDMASILGVDSLGDFSTFSVILFGALIKDIEGEEAYKSRRKSLIMDYIDVFAWGTEYADGRCLVCLDGENMCPKTTEELYDVLEKAYAKNQ